MTDARISPELPGHHKTKKLIRRLGDGAAWKLVCLHLWTASNRPDGDLSGMSAEDIELAVDWAGEPDAFVATLVEVGFIDETPAGYVLHDWAQHQPWVSGSNARSMKARWNAIKRHHGEAVADRQVPEYAAIRVCDDAGSNAPSNAGSKKKGATSNAPSPLPSPLPKSPHTQRARSAADDGARDSGISDQPDDPPELTGHSAVDLRKAAITAGIPPTAIRSLDPIWTEAVEAGVTPDGITDAVTEFARKGVAYCIRTAMSRATDAAERASRGPPNAAAHGGRKPPSATLNAMNTLLAGTSYAPDLAQRHDPNGALEAPPATPRRLPAR